MPIENNSIIIADYDYYPMLLRFKASNKLNIKLMTKEDLIDRIGLSFKEDPIPYMLKLGYEYNKAKKFIKLIRIANINNSKKLTDLYNELKNYITKDSYGLYELKKYNIYLFEMEEDNEAKALLKRNGLSFTDLTVDEIGTDYFDKNNHPDILYFENKFLQYFYIYSDIKKKLNDNPNIKSDIQILVNDDSDIFYTELFSKAFDIPSFGILRKPMISYKSIKDKVSNIFNNKSFEFSNEELEIEELRALKKLIDKYNLANVNFDNAYPDLLEILASNTFKVTTNDRGIIIKSDYTFTQTPYIYVTNFQFGDLYKLETNSDNFYKWQVLSKDKKESVVGHFNVLQKSNVQDTYLDTTGLLDDVMYTAEVVHIEHDIRKFGGLINMLTPIHLNPNGWLVRVLSKHMTIPGEKDSYEAYGSALNNKAVLLNPEWSASGLNDYVRVLGDFGSRIYTIKAHE